MPLPTVRSFLLCTMLALVATPTLAAAKQTPRKAATTGKWVPLFNGKNLDGWTPKFKGSPLGENLNDTFRVENGLLKVSYDKWQRFDRQFGHLAYKRPLSHYRLRVEYRFVGDQVAGGEGWAFRNSGVMLHGQPPATMVKDQEFPVSIELQFLGGKGTGERTTANLCSPGTHVVMNGQLVTKHCNPSTSKTYHGDQWVTVEVEVRGNKSIKHMVDGQTVLAYEEPQLDDTDPDGQRELARTKKKPLDGGYIYLQAESHPVEFRKVELMELAP